MASYPTVDEMRQAEELIAKLETAADDEVVEIMTGVSSHMFWLLDETPGYFDSRYNSNAWHSRLRRCRNSDRRLFEVLT